MCLSRCRNGVLARIFEGRTTLASHYFQILDSHLPSGAVFPMDQAVDFRMVGALHLPDIPLQFLAYPSESRQMPGGSEGTEGSSRPGEIGARFCAVLTGVNQVMNRTPVSSRQSFGRNREVLDPLFGQELPTPTRAAYRNHALLSSQRPPSPSS